MRDAKPIGEIKLVIKGYIPLSTNQRDAILYPSYGVHVLAKTRKEWVEEVGWELKQNHEWRISDRKPFKKAHLLIKIFFRTDAKRDADNYQCKETIDALVQNKLIIDDNFSVIGTPEIDITGRSRIARTEITIIPVK